MSRPNIFRRLFPGVVALTSLLTPMPLFAFEPFVGEITARGVNVRSGPSTNYYIVASLVAGDRVEVVGEDNGWYAIVPPKGCYSLISENYVDVGPDKEGVVNGDAVRVRAGSDLDEHRYAVQLKLDRGAAVTVMGDAVDGFLKILPPPGAQVWIHGDYVQPVPAHMLAATTTTAPTTAAQVKTVVGDPLSAMAVGATPGMNSASPVANPSTNADGPDPSVEMLGGDPVMEPRVATTPVEIPEAAATPKIDYRSMLQEAEGLMLAEMNKPSQERRFDAAKQRYEEIVGQQTDKVSAAYAQRRLAQIDAVQMRGGAIQQMRALTDQVAKDRKEALTARNNLRLDMRPIERGFDAKGELRGSMIFDSPVGPRRYRLVDPQLASPRTLCYVEIPPDSEIDISMYLGQLVGVRARSQFLETGNVNPIPILVVDELVILDETDLVSDGTVVQGETVVSKPVTQAVDSAAAGQ